MMKNNKYAILSVIILGLLAGCDLLGGKSDQSASSSAVSTPISPPQSGIKKTLDVGKIEFETITATGTGITAGAALNAALKNAVMQVNGAIVDSGSANFSLSSNTMAKIDVETSRGNGHINIAEKIQSQQFIELIATESRGVVASFKVLDSDLLSKLSKDYTVKIEAKIAKYKAPSEQGKLKIVVAPLRTNKATFNIGGREVPAQEVVETIHQQIVDSLTQTGRFIVLDRQFDSELQDELDMIGSGQTPNTDFAKLGQAASADIILVSVVNELNYDKHVKHLEMSGRDLVSYSGGWSLSQRMINLSTRQILQSSTLKGVVPSIAPSTLGSNFNQSTTIKNMAVDMVKKVAEVVIQTTFPITIVERDGNNVVLSQGGSSVAENSRYMVYLLGKTIKDPQTGIVLGNMENVCCEVVINRVTPNLSYGVLENVKIKIDGVPSGALQIREMLDNKKEITDTASLEVKPAETAKAKAIKKAAAKEVDDATKKTDNKNKDDW